MSNTTDEMSAQPQTFHLFTKLPKELQIQILQLAAAPDLEWTIHHSMVIEYAMRWYLRDYPKRSLFLALLAFAKASIHYKSRTSLLGATRFTRQIALEEWMADAQSVDVGETAGHELHLDYGGNMSEEQHRELMEEGKGKMLRTIDEMLTDVRGKLADGH